MRRVLSKALNLAEVWGWRREGSNPCRHVPRYPEKGRERFLSEQELDRLCRVLAECEREGSESPYAVAAIRLLLLTGCRRGEILNLRWDEVDFERSCLRLADSKTGAKVVVLNSAARQLLAGLERVEGHPYVLPEQKAGAPLSDLRGPWLRLRRRAGLEDVRRTIFATASPASGWEWGCRCRWLGSCWVTR